MSELQKKIYDYFERDTELRVLFIFNDSVDIFTTAELESVEWKSGYRYIDFKGDWFTTKYRLDNDWQNGEKYHLFTVGQDAAPLHAVLSGRQHKPRHHGAWLHKQLYGCA